MNEKDFDKIDSMIARHIGVFAESINHKFDILVEGHQMLCEKIGRVKTDLEQRIGCVEHKLDVMAAQGSSTAAKLDAVAAQGSSTAAKLDAVAADLKAHRTDTEAHGHIYRVKE